MGGFLVIETGIENLRDPFILRENDTYYIYGTGVDSGDWENTVWMCYKNDSGKLDCNWEIVGKTVYIRPENAEKNLWAPEVHKYKGFYYMFATYYSSLTKHRGCSILKADNPEGPFVEITDGHITPANWDAIDGTFYLDEDGQPWMIFVHEWTCTDDGIGRMAAAKLSDDLTHFISNPIELFRADSPSWATGHVTDGCFMYRTKDKQLLMIWSNACRDGYCVGIARSKDGKVDGEWMQDEELLFSKQTTGIHDGGHGMIFTDTNGQMYLLIHSPNKQTEEHGEKTVLVSVCEENGTLLCRNLK